MNRDNKNKNTTPINDTNEQLYVCMEIAAAESIDGLSYGTPKANDERRQ